MRPTILAFFCALTGCQTVQHSAAITESQPTPIVRLCQHDIPADDMTIKQEVMRHVVPGMPITAARARLEEQDFRVFLNMPTSYRKSSLFSDFDEVTRKRVNSVEFRSTSDVIGAWGQRYVSLRVILYFDENMAITEVEVPHVRSARRAPFAPYFASRPELHEPIGMPIEEAQASMEKAAFRCSKVAADKNEKSGRPYLYCRAVDERALGGYIIRVRLFYDNAGKVTDTRVLKEPESFDNEICMLPDASDTFAHATLKTVVFPARLLTSLTVQRMGEYAALAAR